MRTRHRVPGRGRGDAARLALPAGRRSGPFATIVMAHGFSAVKEMYLDRFAEVFAAAGLAALVFDNRNFGASDGVPRQEIDPWRQIADYRDAISFALTLPRDRRRPDRRLGLELLGRARAGARRDRPAHQVRRGAGAADQRLPQCAPADPRRPDRAGRRGVRRGPPQAGTAAGRRRMLPVVPRTRRARPRCRRPTAGSGSPRPAASARRPGATR